MLCLRSNEEALHGVIELPHHLLHTVEPNAGLLQQLNRPVLAGVHIGITCLLCACVRIVYLIAQCVNQLCFDM